MLLLDKDFAGVQIAGARPYQEDAQGFASLDAVAQVGGESADTDPADSESVPHGESGIGTLLVIMADGMGGENAGDFASRCVVDTFVDYCGRYARKERIPAMLRSAMLAANQALAAAMDENPDLEGMGATLLAAVVTEGSLHWVSVGDSPLYLYRDGELSQINEDHSMMPLLLEQVANGTLNQQDIATHPDRNVLRAAMTGEEIELVDCPLEATLLLPGDIVIVASDGIQTLDQAAIKMRLDRHKNLTAEGITKKLLKAVVREANPKQDNTSINVIRIPLPGEGENREGDEELQSKTRLIRRGVTPPVQ
ncbi:MAG: serine/threonine-protein phosphatase [Akkermansiaceae bacterium]|nr:serine/threonine-protein phosphatase [Akkermansiaceae bacterium]